MKRLLATGLLLCACALLAAGCGETTKAEVAANATPAAQAKTKPACPYPAGWQKLANKVGVPVYCPAWLPDPLKGQIGGRWNNINSVSKDRSWLESFVWQETGGGAAGGELHVNLRGYPGRTAIPTCRTGGADSRNVPCFRGPAGTVTANGITAQLYRVNEDADLWHALLLWRKDGNIYTLSEHVAPPLTYDHVVRYLKQELASLVPVRPA